MSEFEAIFVETRGAVGLVRLNRPAAMNALSERLLRELAEVTAKFEADDGIGAIVLTGNDRVFAAGADIGEVSGKDHPGAYLEDFVTRQWAFLGAIRKPTVAAVAGLALGGGCELAMLCDVVLAADNARFGQPEIALATIPGAGGTQMLTRAVAKSKAMEMVLTGRLMGAVEAERAGLVSRVVPLADLVEEAVKVAERIAGFSRPATMAAKEAVGRAFSTTLAEGVRFERRMFQALFATADRREGMAAFVAKRPPRFVNR